MLVLAAVSDIQYQRLRSAVAPDFVLARAATWDMALETIRGRPLSERAQEVGFRIGLAVVVMLMIFATFNDILRLATS